MERARRAGRQRAGSPVRAGARQRDRGGPRGARGGGRDPGDGLRGRPGPWPARETVMTVPVPVPVPGSFSLELVRGVATITLDRPDRLNSLTFAIYSELAETLAR